MKHTLDLNTWPRRQHFQFFKQFEEPLFGVCVDVDCTYAYQQAKKLDVSFFMYYLYLSLKAANQTEPFRYRIEGDEVVVYDTVNASSTINRPDGTFGFGYIDYYPSFETFLHNARKEVDKVQSTTDLMPSASGQDTIHFSALPWIKFTSLSHARMFSFKDSVPKISFGKVTEENGVRTMPVSIHVHHGLMDGLHVGQYVECFQNLLNADI